ncbi:tetratricopeptide repeat protein [Candidatus Poribacteria bacterium]|nr:tetratricopeptide repeat protein [Candidatus Poribacteria bacterium]
MSENENEKYQHHMEIGSLELGQGSIYVAKKNFERALEEAQKLKDKLCKGLALLMLAKVHHTDCKYKEAENRYKQAIEVFADESAKDNIFESKIGLAYLYLDWEKYEEANKIGDASRILDEIKSQDWNPNQMGKFALIKSEVLIHQGQYTEAGNLLTDALEIVNRELPLHLYIKKAKAYACFRNGSAEEAKKEYEEALKLATELNLPHEEMLIYQDLIFMNYELGAFVSGYRERRERSRKKQDNNYTKIERYHSVALDYLRKEDYQQAYIYLVRENRAYRMAGNLFGHGLADNLASLFSESQEYEKALRCYINLGDTDKIQQISTSIVERIEYDSIHDIFCDMLRGLEKAPVMKKTGVAAALGDLLDISPDELLIDIMQNLLDLTDGEYSFLRNRDVKRTSLKSLEKYIKGQRVPEQVIEKVVDRLIGISNHEKPFVREHVAKCFNAFQSMIPEYSQEMIARHMATWLKEEKSDSVRRILELSITNLANNLSGQWREQLIDALKHHVFKQKDIMDKLGYIMWLGEKVPEDKLKFVLDRIMGNLDTQVNYKEGGNKSLYAGLETLVNMKGQIPDQIKPDLVEKMVLALKNKHNLLDNRRLIIQTISEISSEFNAPLQSKLWDTLLTMFNDRISMIDSGNQIDKEQLQSGLMTSTSLEDIVGDLIYAIAKIYSVSNITDRMILLNSLLIQASGSKESKVRQSAAHCFQYLETINLESQLTIFSLLFDVDDVAAQAIQSVAKLSDKMWDETMLRKVIEKLAIYTDTGKLDTKVATAYALNQLTKRSDLSGDIKKKMQKAKKTLSSDKFYRVRYEVFK